MLNIHNMYIRDTRYVYPVYLACILRDVFNIKPFTEGRTIQITLKAWSLRAWLNEQLT